MYIIAKDISPNLFRNYDIRGALPGFAKRQKTKNELLSKSAYSARLGTDDAYTIGLAIAAYLKPRKVVIGGDMRKSTPKLKNALIHGLLDSGVDVNDIGLASTPLVYFAQAHYKYDAGIEVTASHSIPQLNGFKIHNKDSLPVAKGSGMEKLRQIAIAGKFAKFKKLGRLTKRIDVLDDFVQHLQSLVEIPKIKNLKIVIDAGNGMGGYIARRALAGLDIKIIPMYFKPDGNFPHHIPNPSVPESNKFIIQRIKRENADFGVAFDGDADRVRFFDHTGDIIESSFIACLLAEWVLKKHKQPTIIYTAPMSWAIPDFVEKLGGKPIMTKVGNAFCKLALKENNGVFAGEAAGHFMFKETYNSESAMLPLLIVLEKISSSKKTLRQIITDVSKGYFMSDELNFRVNDAKSLISVLKKQYKDAKKIYELDGLSIEYAEWHYNLRPSANDPVVRLNVEARSRILLSQKIKELTAIINSFAEGKNG